MSELFARGGGRLPFAAALLSLAVLGCSKQSEEASGSTIKVGILHSLTGTMAISESTVVDAVKLAIDEVNAEGGVSGRRLEAVIADGRSDDAVFAREAERLITQEKVAVVFGCWTSSSRKTVKPVFEKHNHLLFYPLQYEGLEQSPNIIYTGAAPNQQIVPAVKWAFSNVGKRMFLVGSDYVFPRTANEIIKGQAASLQGKIVGEEYILLGSSAVEEVVKKILAAKPDFILNTINGDTNVAFFKALRAAGVTPQKVPTFSFSLAEVELAAMGAKDMAGDYAAWNYFQSINSKGNSSFVSAFKARYGQSRVTNDPMEAAYLGVHLWAKAARAAGTTQVEAVRKALPNQNFQAPEGMVYVDPENNHTWKTARIGRIREDGQFDIVWTSDNALRPGPFPFYKDRAQWGQFLESLYRGWNNSWANRG